MAIFLGQTVSKYEDFNDAILQSGMVEVDTESRVTLNDSASPIVGAGSLTINCSGKSAPAYVYDAPGVDHLSFLIRFKAVSGLADWGGGPRLVHVDNPGISDIFSIRDEKSAGTNARQLYCDYFAAPIPVVDGGVYALSCVITRNGAFHYTLYNAANEIVAEATSAYSLPDTSIAQIRLGDDTSNAFPVTIQIDDYAVDTDTAAEILPYEPAPTTFNVLYNPNGATGGLAPSDATEYDPSDPATVLGNTGRLTKARSIFTGWNTAANGTGTHYAPGASITMGSADVTLYAEWSAYTPSGKRIGHANHNPASYSDAQVLAAADLDVYLEHASVGAYIVGGISALRSSVPRLTTGGISWTDTNDPTWFATHNGLGDNNRGNPGSATKISGFASRLASIASAVDVAFYKFCYIDSPASGADLFDAYNASILSLEAIYPGIIIPRCTMPITETGANAERQRFNDLLREYCAANDLWLYDIADMESHNDAGAAQVDGSGYELLAATYSEDGGHPNSSGSEKLALGYWALIAGIAAEVPAEYAFSFNAQGGSSVASQTITDGGHATEPTAPTRTGYTFGGWYKESGCVNTWNFSSDIVTAATTVYAKWTENDTNKVTFDSQGGTAALAQDVSVGEIIGTIPVPYRSGYNFYGWFTQTSGGGTQIIATTVPKEAITCYAYWISVSIPNGNCNIEADSSVYTPIMESSSKVVTLSFVDNDGISITPDTISWSLYDKYNNIVNSKNNVSETINSTIRIILNEDDNNSSWIFDGRKLVVTATYTSIDGPGQYMSAEYQYPIIKITGK